jgi:hypothetical protein
VNEDGSIDQTRLTHVAVSGQETERTLAYEDFDAWALERAKRCGHALPSLRCRMCRGTQLVADSFGWETHIVVMAAR